MHTQYRPGPWNVLVLPGAVIALAPEASAVLIASMWERLAGDRTLAAVVDTIAESTGGSFTALPDFAAVVLEGANARVAVRGDVSVAVTGANGEQELSGADVTTWREHFIPGAGRVALRLSDPDATPEFPLVGGVVCAAHVVADLTPADIVESVSPAVAAESGAAETAPAPAVAESVITELPDAVLPSVGVPVIAVAATAPPLPPLPPVPLPVAPVTAELPSIADEGEASGTEGDDSADAPAPAADVDAEPESVIVPESVIEPEIEPEPLVEPEPASEAAPEPLVEPDAEPEASEAESVVDAYGDTLGSEFSGHTLIPSDQTIDSDFDEFQQLFGDTVHVAPARPGVFAPAPVVGDHDGATISVAEARALRGEVPPVTTAAPDAPTALIPTAAAGRVRVSTGQVVALDRTVVIGRRPRAPRASGAELPHLIAVDSPQQDISRSHLEIRPEGDTVVVIDLHTTNGSTLLRPGADPVRLHPGEPTLVLSGDIVDLGDGVTVVFEDLP